MGHMRISRHGWILVSYLCCCPCVSSELTLTDSFQIFLRVSHFYLSSISSFVCLQSDLSLLRKTNQKRIKAQVKWCGQTTIHHVGRPTSFLPAFSKNFSLLLWCHRPSLSSIYLRSSSTSSTTVGCYCMADTFITSGLILLWPELPVTSVGHRLGSSSADSLIP